MISSIRAVIIKRGGSEPLGDYFEDQIETGIEIFKSIVITRESESSSNYTLDACVKMDFSNDGNGDHAVQGDIQFKLLIYSINTSTYI